ncbi:MAG: HAMP domain-containing histidine kinase [Proteobacteria bacterium]|nr:HAMP domain-containing histidine kinase [Pseudomonadota bacterium]MBU4470733.1 HAMP domain-containing histidine kinase [Pseudomonadota bacterium]MCG2751539.1 HAMP domain-containing histidine kinase [Desulfobacteraceae bacterium]
MPSIQRILKVPRTIGFKIAAGYSFLFACSFVGLTIFAYLFLESTLARQDRQMIRDEVESLQGHYNSGGWAAFNQTVVDNDRFRKNNPFFTRVIQGPAKGEMVFFPQYWKEFDLAALKELPGQTTGKWINLPNQGQTYTLEIFTASQPNGSLFQVGISTEERLADLQRYKQSFLVVSIPLILLAAGGGAFLSRRTLRPLRNLILTVESIESGKMDARVPETHTGDELDELGRLFNRMIEKINQLIQGMKGSLDSVAHDLRTPMTRFRNIAEAALQKDHTAAVYREALQECVDESDRILRMLHMLMDISEAEAGTMRLRLQPVNLVPLAEGIVDMYDYVAEEKGIQIKTDFPGEALLEADADRICQVLANLLDNAVKFTDPGGEVNVSIKNLPGFVQVKVADSGVGIPPEEIQKIWDRLYRGGGAIQKGLGLGLSVVNAVVHAHLGDVHVSSVPGSGSIFTVQLPVH